MHRSTEHYAERVNNACRDFSGAVAAEVRSWMGRRNRSGRNVAQELGWTEIYLSRRLTGKVPFDVDDLDALAGLLGVPVTEFFDVRGGLVRGVTNLSSLTPRAGLGLAA